MEMHCVWNCGVCIFFYMYQWPGCCIELCCYISLKKAIM
uniref:Uncharacterized protein n=1 Tax=Anguilla anguilla TaxID=7936 RepID=A0A0E9RKG3_ANGAN